MVGGFSRKESMERKDVMTKNVSVYGSQASALEKHDVAKINRVMVVACNTLNEGQWQYMTPYV